MASTQPPFEAVEGTEPVPASMKPRRNGATAFPYPVQDAPSAPEGENRPITIRDVLRWLGLARPAFAALLAIVGIVGWFGHVLWTGGWINKPVQETRLQAVVTKQDSTNAAILNRIENMDAVLSSHSSLLVRLMAASQEQSRVSARIEGFLAARLPTSAAAPLPAPAPMPIPPPKSVRKSDRISTSNAWAARSVAVK